MFTISIDSREVEVAPGQTLLDAARKLGLDIPTLCYLEKCGPLTTCLVCVVRVRWNGQNRIMPACGTLAQPGMIVENATEEIYQLRRSALELLLSDHVGDCLSPCHRLCPLGLNIPRLLRQIQTQQMSEAIATVRNALPLPAITGRLCHHPCEQGCRRSNCDSAAAIRELERFVADTDLAAPQPQLPACKPSSGKRVAVIGAGPSGLAAAWQLARDGHACVVCDRRDRAGGSLLQCVTQGSLPPAVLEAELRQFERLGIRFRLRTELGRTTSLAELQAEFDAVLLAPGEVTPAEAAAWGLAATKSGIEVDAQTAQTNLPKCFAAGSVVRPVKHVVRALTEGQQAARIVHQSLCGLPLRRLGQPFSSVMGRLEPRELNLMLHGIGGGPRRTPSRGLDCGFLPTEASQEAGRCLHCDCRAAGHCSLQHYAEVYGAEPNRFPRQRRGFEQVRHPGNVIFEPGKCILCGICIEIARKAAEPLGLTFVGRGFDVRVAAPFDETFAAGLRSVARDCAESCPTGAIVLEETAPAKV